LLQHHLDSDKPLNKEKYEEQCVHASEREKRAAEAERASIKFKQVEFMSSVLGQSFNGIVTGVTEWGVFVEITETKCEGMVRITDIDDDHYEFDEKNYRIVGRNNKKMISLGDKTRVKIIRTDINRRTIDLEFSTE
jgi:ribonuclease R